jgi:hypothetical protein
VNHPVSRPVDTLASGDVLEALAALWRTKLARGSIRRLHGQRKMAQVSVGCPGATGAERRFHCWGGIVGEARLRSPEWSRQARRAGSPGGRTSCGGSNSGMIRLRTAPFGSRRTREALDQLAFTANPIEVERLSDDAGAAALEASGVETGDFLGK